MMPLDPLSSPVPHPPLQRLLEVHEVAYYLKCSQETVRRLIRDGKLPAIRLGTQWRVDPRDLQAFMDQHRHASRDERRGRHIQPRADEARDG